MVNCIIFLQFGFSRTIKIILMEIVLLMFLIQFLFKIVFCTWKLQFQFQIIHIFFWRASRADLKLFLIKIVSLNSEYNFYLELYFCIKNIISIGVRKFSWVRFARRFHGARFARAYRTVRPTEFAAPRTVRSTGIISNKNDEIAIDKY